MALTATLYNFDTELADIDRGVYQTLALRLARHPSETPEFMLTRLLAYCLEYTDGIEFTDGVSAGDDPAVLVRDMTGRITAWVEVGMPDAALPAGPAMAGRKARRQARTRRPGSGKGTSPRSLGPGKTPPSYITRGRPGRGPAA